MTITIDLWAVLVAVVVVFIAGLATGWAWGYTRGDNRWR